MVLDQEASSSYINQTYKLSELPATKYPTTLLVVLMDRSHLLSGLQTPMSPVRMVFSASLSSAINLAFQATYSHLH
jgi:hypothetical protein